MSNDDRKRGVPWWVAARASEATVQKVARGEHQPPPRAPRAAPSRRSSPITSIRVRPDVWAKALEIAEGEPRRIQVFAADDVIVWNHPWR